ncbi:MAG: arsenosugar biosynthesis radical SAM protein ArsS [Planctomycetes bacterium]|nr:arsenosugar biosynthesis radical SAM protein ArsS [Planctomycetota bacterium]
MPTLEERRSPLAAAREQIARVAGVAIEGGDFDARLAEADLFPLRARGLQVFQINLGKLCNQTCAHCHVDAGPTREEAMTRATAELCLDVLARTEIPIVDITGGAPELNPNFEFLVEGARALGRHVLDRCNLTILESRRFAELPAFLAEHQVEVVASLPHYRALNTDKQRGAGVFEQSIAGLKRLNAVGYGRGDGLKLVLVTNPVGAILPSSSQAALQVEWKRELRRLHGIEFDELHTITNMPIARYLEWLVASDNLEDYLSKLVQAFNPAAAAGVMCRTMVSVGWDGRLHDCDFNQMLDLECGFGAPRHLAEFDVEKLATRRIVTARHCFGCTAGAGSSCGGQLA